MKKTILAGATLVAMALSLSACGGKGDDKLGSEVEKSYDNRADAMEQAADNLKDQAKEIRKSGEQQADAGPDLAEVGLSGAVLQMFSHGVIAGLLFGVVGRAFPPEKRSMALGIAGAAGSLGQFVMLPFGQLLINQLGWHNALMTLALVVLVIAPLSAAMVEDGSTQPASQSRQSVPEALREAGITTSGTRALEGVPG